MKQSILRTVVPILYALLVKAGLGKLGVDDTLIQGLATLIVTGLIYAAVRVVERFAPKFGWLLGYPAAPTYTSAPANTDDGQEG